MIATILPLEFYSQDDVVDLAKKLLGKWLMTDINGEITGGKIIETEAYRYDDKACHAYNFRKTKRTEVMFQLGGIAYVYLCYGIHHLFNIVTGNQDIPQAILVRALEPTEGIEIMQKRRQSEKNLTSGPGMICQALGIDRSHTALPLINPPIWIEDRGINSEQFSIQATQRIGVEYAKEDALLPWRFLLENQL